MEGFSGGRLGDYESEDRIRSLAKQGGDETVYMWIMRKSIVQVLAI